MQQVKVYQPEYYKNFACIGGECRNNCCRYGWTIIIDKATYEKYKNLETPDRDVILKSIEIVSEDPFKARLIMNDDGTCGLLNESGFCSIHLARGQEYLSKTCSNYPRKNNVIFGLLERYVELSCEVAVELALFNRDIMKFEEEVMNYEPDDSFSIRGKLQPELYTKAPNAGAIFWKLRVASLVIMQSRQYKVRLRMLILCLFIQDASDLLTTGRDSEVVSLADMYIQRLDIGYFDDLARELPDGGPIQADVILDILRSMAWENDKVFNRYLKKSLDAFNIKSFDGDLPESLPDDYQMYYNLYLADKEYIFENYIVQSIMLESFPFDLKHEAGIMQNYVKLMAKYELLSLLLVGVCRSSMKFVKRDVVECIVYFSRGYSHRGKTGFLKSE